jgi:hypothetical protein
VAITGTVSVAVTLLKRVVTCIAEVVIFTQMVDVAWCVVTFCVTKDVLVRVIVVLVVVLVVAVTDFVSVLVAVVVKSAVVRLARIDGQPLKMQTSATSATTVVAGTFNPFPILNRSPRGCLLRAFPPVIISFSLSKDRCDDACYAL